MAALPEGGACASSPPLALTPPVLLPQPSASQPPQALTPTAPLPTLTPPPSFSNALLGSTTPSSISLPSDQLFNRTPKINLSALPRPIKTTHKGEIGLIFPKPLISAYSQQLRFALIGKFAGKKPPLESIRKIFKSLDFSSPFTIGLLDYRHILLNFAGEMDFHRIYSKDTWIIDGQPMRIFKWSPGFHVDKEPTTKPVWFSFEKIPQEFLNGDALFSIGNQFGTALRIDKATVTGIRPNCARLQVEIDLLKPLPSRIWLQLQGSEEGFWQNFSPEGDIPSYCTSCWKQGHYADICHQLHPELKQAKPPVHQGGTTQHVYRPKKADPRGKEKDALPENTQTASVAGASAAASLPHFQIQPPPSSPILLQSDSHSGTNHSLSSSFQVPHGNGSDKEGGSVRSPCSVEAELASGSRIGDSPVILSEFAVPSPSVIPNHHSPLDSTVILSQNVVPSLSVIPNVSPSVAPPPLCNPHFAAENAPASPAVNATEHFSLPPPDHISTSDSEVDTKRKVQISQLHSLIDSLDKGHSLQKCNSFSGLHDQFPDLHDDFIADFNILLQKISPKMSMVNNDSVVASEALPASDNSMDPVSAIPVSLAVNVDSLIDNSVAASHVIPATDASLLEKVPLSDANLLTALSSEYSLVSHASVLYDASVNSAVPHASVSPSCTPALNISQAPNHASPSSLNLGTVARSNNTKKDKKKHGQSRNTTISAPVTRAKNQELHKSVLND